jgi:two-component system sensor histidine kinase DesK
LKAAEIEFNLEGTAELQDTPLLVETVLSMCLKEAVTNIVKHSGADCCNIVIEELQTGVTIKVQDNGVGLSHRSEYIKGNGLQGMKERLEFVNGSLDIKSTDGTTLYIRVPNAIKNNG